MEVLGMSTEPLSFTDNQIAEILRYARMVSDDADRDLFFEQVADALRGRDFTDDDVNRAATAAWRPFEVARNHRFD
jgi:hypothetical protein